jgi:hypothetical protein
VQLLLEARVDMYMNAMGIMRPLHYKVYLTAMQ